MSELAEELERLRVYADPPRLPVAGAGPFGTADMRCIAEDFFVAEHSGLVPAGAGEHLFLRIRKIGQNTRWVAKRLAEMAAVPERAVSFAGMKDRHAVTEQWFGLHLPGRVEPVFNIPAGEGIEILQAVWHNRKLRPGQLSYNQFRLRLRNCVMSDPVSFESCLHALRTAGVPNYFGAQRFGFEQANLFIIRDIRSLPGIPREQRSFALSALRGALFNGYLAARVAAGSWADGLAGDVEISDRPRGVAEADQSIFALQRLPAGLLWGNKYQPAQEAAGNCEQEFYGQFPAVMSLLEDAGCRAARRVLRARIGNLSCQQEGDQVELNFALGPGSYATMVLRELLVITDQRAAG
jgi:tRNA pseudouridine13 synthase